MKSKSDMEIKMEKARKVMAELIKDEPNSKEWVAHGLDCHLIRNKVSKVWCGYVGLPEGHAWYGKEYSELVSVPDEIINRSVDMDKVGAINMFCAGLKNSEESLKAGLLEMCLAIDVHGGITYSRKGAGGYLAEGLWWLGFDCGHAGDLSAYSIMGFKDTYRNEKFATDEAEGMAKQLAFIGEYIKQKEGDKQNGTD